MVDNENQWEDIEYSDESGDVEEYGYYYGNHSSKKYGKKSVAYSMLCDILDWED